MTHSCPRCGCTVKRFWLCDECEAEKQNERRLERLEAEHLRNADAEDEERREEAHRPPVW